MRRRRDMRRCTSPDARRDAARRVSRLSARINAYELAFRMQMSATECTDLSREPESIRKLYGLDHPAVVSVRHAGERANGEWFVVTERWTGPSLGAMLTHDASVQYGRERFAFGKPIIKREVWQHKLVDLYPRCEAA